MRPVSPLRRYLLVFASAALLLLALTPVAGAGLVSQGTVNVYVYWATGPDRPVPGVEVWLRDTTAGVSYYACTDATGKATFPGIPAGNNLISATGRAVSQRCASADFVRPDGKKMYWMSYNNHSLGVGGFDGFQVTVGATKTIKFYPVTPANQNTVCWGMPTTKTGTPGNDFIKGTAGDDIINAGAGNDVVFGLGGNDAICGGAGNDILFGDVGNDAVAGDAGNDTLIGDGGDDWLTGGLGLDWLFGREGNDKLFGQGGAPDTAVVGPGTDTCDATTTEVCKTWGSFI